MVSHVQIGTILLYVSPVIVPLWVMYDSKRKLGRINWGLTLLITFLLAALVRQTVIEFELQQETETVLTGVVIWGKTLAAYLLAFLAYKVGSKIILKRRKAHDSTERR